MDYRSKFYRKYVSTHVNNLYGEQTLENFRKEFSAFKAYFGRFLSKEKTVKVLDLACGSGGFLYWLEQSGYSAVYGIDTSREQIEFAKKLGVNNAYETDAVSFLKSKKEEYDIIFARDFLEHLNKNELLEVTECIFNSLKRGGIFMVQTVNAETLFGARLRYSDMTHEIAFTQTSIEQLLRVAGFVNVAVYPMRPVVHGIFSFARYCIWGIIEFFSHVALIIATGYKKGIFTQDILCVARK